jgi:adenosylhomocysteine nucleosidase
MKFARHIICILSAFCFLWFSVDSAQADQKLSGPGSSGYLGLLIPVGPAHYTVILKKFKKIKSVRIGQFDYQIGSIYKIPVVICIQPFGGEYTRALTAQVMVDHFKIKALLYPGTSGAHIPPGQMHVGDIVIGTKQVNFANFYMSPTGDITPDEFSGKSSLQDYQYFYLDKKLEKYTACAAQYVSDREKLPSWVNGKFKIKKPEIYYYGIQGTSSMWLADKSFIKKTDDVFHEVDEDGDWYSATVAKLANIPFIEVSTISDSVFEFSGNGVPPQGAHRKTASQITQDISDKIMLRVIKIYGHNLLYKKYNYPSRDPYPSYFYQTPTDPRGLVDGCKT